jgi:primosomal protein N' (replication factor Y)
MHFAELCVNTPLGRRGSAEPEAYDPLGPTFTYAVPERLVGRLQPGHLVWVQFGPRRVQAVVLQLTDSAPDFDTREIHSLVWAQPLLNTAQLALARWLAGYYLAPLIETLRLMMPAGLSQRGRTIFERTGMSAPSDLTPRQAALLARITEAAGEWSEVSAGLRATQKDDLEPLIQKGLVARESAFPAPPRPKVDRAVRLLADAEAIARALPSLGRASKQADALAWLAQRSPPPGGLASGAPTLDEVCAGAGCAPDAVEALAARGPRSPNGGWLSINAPDAEAGKRPRKGLSTVQLALTPAEALDALVALRGAEKHRAVLDLLQRQGTTWIGRVYAETGASLATLRDLEAAGLVAIEETVVWRDPLAGRPVSPPASQPAAASQDFAADRPPILTADQQAAWDEIRVAVEDPQKGMEAPESGGAFLLHGVTGSGKTEIYLRALEATLARGRQAVVLTPEIALTPQTIRRFAARFPGRVTVWHSELGDGERFDVWRRVHAGHPAAQVVVGSRSALFLPFPDLGLIVLDEEHEAAYKQERTPRYHARTVALELGRLCRAPVLLGSATPALETYYAARRGDIRLLTLPQRILGHRTASDAPDLFAAAAEQEISAELPPVQVVDMRQELRANNRSMFSRALAVGIRQALDAGQQAILYLNRRGAATFVMCRDCGHVEACPRCSGPLTLHSPPGGQPAATSNPYLLCHHCNKRYPVPAVCPDCQGRRIRYFGSGTEKIEEAVALEFPGARTLRWDRDVTGAKGAHDAILDRFVAHQADVLIGTQMIAKGLDLPLVTLVGVIAADTGLFLPDFRAAERTFQLLTQVAGRAGRSALGGQVIVQTYHPDHYAVVAASRHDYEAFYRQEMAFRRAQGYPPLQRLARLVYHHTQRAKGEAEATRMAGLLRIEIERLSKISDRESKIPKGGEMGEMRLIGPAPCFFSRQRGEWRWQVVLCGPDPNALLRRVPLPDGWRLDIDPVDLL